MRYCLLLSFCCLLAVLNSAITVFAAEGSLTGLTSYQLFQRDARNQADIRITATGTGGSGAMQARIVDARTGALLRDWQPVGRLENGTAKGLIQALPAGGPYTIQVALTDGKGKRLALYTFDQILVGDIWLLAGQSNMQGIAELQGAEDPSVFVHSYGYDEKWAIAADPLHWLLDSIDPVHQQGLSGEELLKRRAADKIYARTGAGLGLPFAKAMVQATGVPVGLLPCAHGGTSMEQWDPAKRDEGGLSLYGSMYRRFLAAGGRVKGVLWYQGEADANGQAAPLYIERMRRFIDAMRKDLGDDRLSFYLVQLGRYITASESPSWNDIREAQRLLPGQIPGIGTVAAMDLEMDDPIHVGTQGHKRLGHRLAQLALRDLFGRGDLLPGPELSGISLRVDRSTIYQLAFKNVNGRLLAPDKVDGFSVRDAQGKDLHLIFKASITEDGRAIDLYMREAPPAGAALWYGYGCDPICDVVDQSDMALAAFGPLPIDQASYDAFMSLARQKPDDPALLRLLPQAISILKRRPELGTELSVRINDLLARGKAEDRILLYPYLFALGDFKLWPEWLQQVRKADLQERKRLAAAWTQAADFPQLPCPLVSRYLIAGAFDNAQDKGFDTAYSPEKNTDPAAVFNDALGGPAGFKPAAAEPHGFLNLLGAFPQQENVIAYALVEVSASREAEIPILLGSDDAAAVWVNGREVYREHAHRAARPAQDLLLANLNPGVNHVLIKVEQVGGDWGLYLQFVDKDRVLSY